MRLAVSRKYVPYKWIPQLEHRMGKEDEAGGQQRPEHKGLVRRAKQFEL